MQEYFSEALVLNKEPSGDMDSRLYVFTKRFGKIIAKAKSARKITSKLSAHLEPGNVVKLRFIEKRGPQVVDALKIAKLSIPTSELYKLNDMLVENEPDLAFWNEIIFGEFNWRRVLKILGWDQKGAICSICGKRDVESFDMDCHESFCASCSVKLKKDRILHIGQF